MSEWKKRGDNWWAVVGECMVDLYPDGDRWRAKTAVRRGGEWWFLCGTGRTEADALRELASQLTWHDRDAAKKLREMGVPEGDR